MLRHFKILSGLQMTFQKHKRVSGQNGGVDIVKNKIVKKNIQADLRKIALFWE